MDEEKWIKAIELQRVTNLVDEKEKINYVQKLWDEILKQYDISYKFDIVQESEYRNGGRTKGQLQVVYVLNLYTTKENLSKMKEIINEYEKEKIIKKETQDIQLEKEVEEEYEQLTPVKFQKYFLTAILLISILIEIVIVISLFIEGGDQGIMEYGIIIVFLIIEIYVLKRIWKKKRK